ncbi:hypothetical protein ABZ801_00525 [Actinomadura sp. NPDC047616]|uniref:hypothetical protein n=1 Tax=Actinomadura sp. NPDC047616 TaxID=3155914 RepID=UPI0033C90425
MIATYDIERSNLVVLVCRDVGCARRGTVVVRNEVDPVHRLAMEVDRQGRPRILRYGIDFGDYVGAQLLICRDPHCGAWHRVRPRDKERASPAAFSTSRWSR